MVIFILIMQLMYYLIKKKSNWFIKFSKLLIRHNIKTINILKLLLLKQEQL